MSATANTTEQVQPKPVEVAPPQGRLTFVELSPEEDIRIEWVMDAFARQTGTVRLVRVEEWICDLQPEEGGWCARGLLGPREDILAVVQATQAEMNSWGGQFPPFEDQAARLKEIEAGKVLCRPPAPSHDNTLPPVTADVAGCAPDC